MTTKLQRLIGATVLATASVSALAATPFPTKTIRIIVNAAPGANLDVTARVIAQKMADNLGQPVIVENKAGASGLLGIHFVKSAPADGYTVLAASNTIAYGAAFKLDPGYDLVKDFAAIGPIMQFPLVMVGSSEQPAKTLPDFIAQAKANPDKMAFASGGVGTTTYMAAALLLHQANLKLLHVPYKGSAAAMPDVLSGRVNMIFDGLSTTSIHIREGKKLRAFGVTSPKRLAAFPDIPTVAEQGLPNYSYTSYLGLVAPAGTPKDVVQRLSKALHAAITNDVVRDTFRGQGSEPWVISPDEFTQVLKQDAEQTMKVASDMGIPKQ